MQLYDEALVDYIKLDAYWFLRSAINTKDEVSDQQTSKLESEFSEKTAFVQTELVTIEKAKLDQFLHEEPKLQKYQFAIESISRNRPHTLSLKEEEILGSIDPSVTGWQFGLYRQILGNTKFADIQAGGRTLNVRTQRADIANDPDRQIREQGFLKLYEGYASQRNLYAYALIQTVNAKNTVARLRNFEDAADQIYFNSFWTKQEVRNLLESVATAAELYKRYQKLRADYVSKQKSIPDVAYWDVSGASVENVPRFTIHKLLMQSSTLSHHWGQNIPKNWVCCLIPRTEGWTSLRERIENQEASPRDFREFQQYFLLEGLKVITMMFAF